MSDSGDTVGEEPPSSRHEDLPPDTVGEEPSASRKLEDTEGPSRGSVCDRPSSILPKHVRNPYVISVIKRIEGQRVDITGPLPGASFNRNYTTLYLLKGDSEGVNLQHEVWQLEKASKMEKSLFDQMKCTEVFERLAASETDIQRVLTKGIAGIGKTFSVYKFTLDWAGGVANQHIDLVILMSFRELNLVRDEQHSLLSLIHDFHPTLKKVTAEQLAACKTVFIFDGLDESRFPLKFENIDIDSDVFDNNDIVSDLTVTSSVGVLLTNLIKGNLLPSALLWITTRPAAAYRIPPQCIDRVTEVRGFTDPQKEEFFRKRFSDDEELASRIISHVNKTKSFHILCHIPLVCWIAATVLEVLLKSDGTRQLPTTPTEMFAHFILVQIWRKNLKYDEKGELSQQQLMATNREGLLKLSMLAFLHLKKGSLMFYQEDLEECGLDVNDAVLYSGVCTQIFKRESVIFEMKVYSFVHLSIQEFLAAVYLMHCFTERNTEVLKTFLGEDFSHMSLGDFLKKATLKAVKSKNGHLDLFIRFLHGLSLQSSQSLLGGLLGQTENSPEEIQRVINNLKEMSIEEGDASPDRCLNIFHCLMEMKDDSVHQEIQQFLESGDRSKTELSETQCSALAHMLLMSEEVLDEFDLDKYNTSGWGEERLLPAVRNCKKARLGDVAINEAACEVLVSALSSNPSYLVELEISGTTLDEDTVKRLCDAMMSPHCILKNLMLSDCGLSESCCEHLASVLCSSSSLHELDVSHNGLTDAGIAKLLPGLESQQCRLKILRLRQTDLTEKCCNELSSHISSNSSSLTELDLNSNNLRNHGVIQLSVGLKSPNCTLEILRLSHCLVSEEGFSCLASALRSNLSHMKELDMSFNQPGASGGEQLLSVGLATLKLDQEEEYSPLLLKTYAFPLTLDTNTTNPDLSLSENNRKVTRTSEPQSYPDHPGRFQNFQQVLCREGLTGCWYGEVEWSGYVLIGGTSIRINRRGTGDDALLGSNDLSWSLCCDDGDNRYAVYHNKKRTILLVRPSGSNRVAVYVDRPAGRLSFYRVSSETHTHLYTFQTTFTETLYAGFWVGSGSSSVSLCQIEPVVPTSFSPVVHREHTTTEYRFQCPGAGLFQCSDTRLVFGTWRGGDVLYRTVQWEERCLPSTGRTPAGPLFDIQCPQNAVCQLHLPHCAITPGDVDLCVANITDGAACLLEPQKVTQTHVVLNVDHLSLYGLLWKKIKEYFCPISGQVLLFLQPPGRQTQKLSLLMLPGNADLDKVKTFYEKYNRKDILESTSDCELTPDLLYRLQCDSHCLNPTIHPENVKYRLNYGPNYNPTFKVTMYRNTEVASLAILGPENHQVWKDDIELEDASAPSPGSAPSQPDATTAMAPQQGAETLRSVRLGFITRVSEPVIHALLDRLLDENVLNDVEMDSVRLEKGRTERARTLIDMVRKKGDEASAKMIAAFRKEDPTFYDDMGLNKP